MKASPARSRPAARWRSRPPPRPPAAPASELCSGDMLLEALVACAGVTLKSVATAVEVPLKTGNVNRRGRSGFSRHARRRQGSPGRLRGNPSALRGRNRCAAGQARPAAETHRTLLRGLSDHQERPEDLGVDEAGLARCRPCLVRDCARAQGPITTDSDRCGK